MSITCTSGEPVSLLLDYAALCEAESAWDDDAAVRQCAAPLGMMMQQSADAAVCLNDEENGLLQKEHIS